MSRENGSIFKRQPIKIYFRALQRKLHENKYKESDLFKQNKIICESICEQLSIKKV